MKPRNWLLSSLGLVLAIAGIVIAVNVYLDIYGIFRDPRGKCLPAYGDERIAKYLLSERYVPANFNAVLIGSSVTSNWRLDRITALRVYNDSANGGNSVEEKCLVDQALSRPGVQVALLLVHPFLTHSHDFETVQLTPRERTAALGSLSLFDAYKSMLRARLHLEEQTFDEFGGQEFMAGHMELNPTLKRMLSGSGDFEVDPVAMAAYRDSIAQLHAHGVRIVFFVPPLEERLLVSKRDAFANYLAAVRPLMSPQDLLIDFTTDEFASLRADRRLYLDGVHMVHDGAAQVVALIDARIAEWIAQGKLRTSM